MSDKLLGSRNMFVCFKCFLTHRVSGGIVFLLLLASAILAACRPAFSSPQEALTQFPGYLISSDYYDPESVRISQTLEVEGGQILVYYWRVKSESRCHLSITFVSKESFGWQAHSSGDMQSDCEPSHSSNWESSALIGGSIRDLTAVYGVSPKGTFVRVTWPDGSSATSPLSDGVFVVARSERLMSWRLELLDAEGRLLENQDVDIMH